MKKIKKMVALATLLVMFGSATGLNAQDDCCTAYTDGCCSPNLAPAIALGTIAVVAIIAVAVQNRSHGHGHVHD